MRQLWGDKVELLAFRQRRLPGVITSSRERDVSRRVEDEFSLTVFESLDDALSAKPDGVFVCTPSSKHLEIAQPAAAAGCHLFIEKPLSHTLVGVETLRRTIAVGKLVALVGCQWRYHPCIQWLRRVLKAGTLGQVHDVEIEYGEYLPDWHPYEDYRASYAARAEFGGGVILTQIHDYDLAWWLFGPARRVRASGGRLSELDVDVEDTVDARLECSVPVRIRQTFASRPARRLITVRGEHGSIVIDLLAAAITTDSPVVTPPHEIGYERNQMFIDELTHFEACVAGRDQPLVPIEDGIAVLRVALAVKTALQTGDTIDIGKDE